MPTYEYLCSMCGHEAETVQSIRSYSTDPIVPPCPRHEGRYMQRKLSVNPAFSGLANALAGDRHYEGMRAPDGSDISSRTKHREYMARTGLTTTSDFTETWKKQTTERENFRQGAFTDKELRTEVAKQVYDQVNKGT